MAVCWTCTSAETSRSMVKDNRKMQLVNTRGWLQGQRASASSIPGQRASASSLPLVAPTFETAYGAPFGGEDGASLVSADQSHVTGSDSPGGDNEAQV
jgi:hypothetical protein